VTTLLKNKEAPYVTASMGLARMLSYYMDEDYPEGPEIQLLLSE